MDLIDGSAAKSYASRCGGCLCNRCKYSVELPAEFSLIDSFGPDDVMCFNCDECRYYDGDTQKKHKLTRNCQKYIESAGSLSARSEAAQRTAERERARFRIVGGEHK